MKVVDLETGAGDVYQATVESKEPSRNWVWKTVSAVVLIVLCSAASVLFAWHFMSDSQTELTAVLQRNPTTAHHQHMLTQIAKNTKAAIHLHVSARSEGSEPLHWVNDVDQSFSTGGLKLENNEIVIPSDGLYFVYSQASFSVPCYSEESDPDSSDTPLSFSIQWSSPAAPSSKAMYLLSGVKSTCQSSSQEKMKYDDAMYDVIYLGAVFRLYKGDKLSTAANHLAHIERQSSKTFFGVFEL